MSIGARRDTISTHDDASVDAAEVEAERASARAEQARLRAKELRRRAGAAQVASPPTGMTERIAHGARDADPTEDADLEATRASARARQARQRAVELRRQADAAGPVEVAPTPEATRKTLVWLGFCRWRPDRPRPRTLAVVLAVLLVCASGVASGSMWWTHRTLMEERQRTAEITSAARSKLTDLMSIDYTKARDGVQRVIDDSTGQFKDQFQASADDLVAGLEQSKVLTTVTIKVVAVKSMTNDSAVVLVAARSQASSLQGAQRDPRDFRVELTLLRDAGQLKLSRVEFVK